jgi:hypothetical protein
MPWRESSLLNLYGANSRLVWVRRVSLAMEAHAVGAWLSAKPHVARHFRRLVANQQALFLLVGVGLVIILFAVNVIAATAVTAAWVALMRHYAQTEADRQRRITESFSKAVEQLANDKLEIRLGGIYTLERISGRVSAIIG